MTAAAIRAPEDAPPSEPASHVRAADAAGRPSAGPDGASPPEGLPDADAAVSLLTRCPHSLPLSGAEECRRCLPVGVSVAEFIAAHPDGAELPEIAAMFGMTKQGAAAHERRAEKKLVRGLLRLFPELGRELGRVRLNDAQRFRAIVRRMLRDGFESDEIADNLNEPQWRVRRAIESKGA